MSLTPILVTGFGRSGTTALMELLATSDRIAFDRRYPFENRWLTYLAKFARLAVIGTTDTSLDSEALCDFDSAKLGGLPWPVDPAPRLDPLIALQEPDLLTMTWSAFSAHARERFPEATHYGEKSPAWLPAAVRDVLPARTIHLVRDPRDVWLSVAAFNRARGSLAFGRKPGDTDRDYARTLAHALLSYFENLRSDCLTVRYEDLISERAAAIARLSSFIGANLATSAEEPDYLPMHRTTATAEESLYRWQREPLPAEVRQTFESILAELMTANGYRPAVETRQIVELSPHTGSTHDGTFQRDAHEDLSITVNGPDFWIEVPSMELPARAATEIWACVRGDTGDTCSLYWRRHREPFDEGRSVHVRWHPGRHWQVIRFPVAGHPHWHGTIAQLRLDLFNGPIAVGAGALRWLRVVS